MLTASSSGPLLGIAIVVWYIDEAVDTHTARRSPRMSTPFGR